MKNKKGFTLVELLAVVAILAVLVIIALPNVMSLFNNAKKNAFTTELKEIYRAAEQKWMSDSVVSTANVYYARVEGNDTGTCSSCQQLKLSGRGELHYMISFTKGGKVRSFYATDGTYQYAYTGNGLKIEDIKSEDVIQVAGLPESTGEDPTIENTVLTITCNDENYVDTSIGVVGGPARFVANYYDGDTKLGTESYYENGVTQSFKTASDYGLTKSGYQFQGWGLTTSTKTFDAGATVTPEIIKQYEGNNNLYAIWRDTVTPSCYLSISGSYIGISRTNAVQYGLVNGGSNTPNYNSTTSLALSTGTGTYTYSGYVKGSTGIQKGCRAQVSQISYKCPTGYSLSGTSCHATGTPKYLRQNYICRQNGSTYSWVSQGSSTVTSCNGPQNPSSACTQNNVNQSTYTCRSQGYTCPNGSTSSSSTCSATATRYCNSGTMTGNYCISTSTF